MGTASSWARIFVGMTFAVALGACGPSSDGGDDTAGSGGSGGGGGSGGSGSDSSSNDECSAAPQPVPGKPLGSVTSDERAPEALVPVLGAAASIHDDGVTSRALELRLTDYANACDYRAAGLGKEGALALSILIQPLDGDVSTGSYLASAGAEVPGQNAYIASSPSTVCDGNNLSALNDGTATVLALDSQHVVVELDISGGLVRLKGTIDAPLCNGPADCGCAP
jgi:hypothetical protein